MVLRIETRGANLVVAASEALAVAALVCGVDAAVVLDDGGLEGLPEALVGGLALLGAGGKGSNLLSGGAGSGGGSRGVVGGVGNHFEEVELLWGKCGVWRKFVEEMSCLWRGWKSTRRLIDRCGRW